MNTSEKSISLKTTDVTSEQAYLPCLLSVLKTPFEVVALKRAVTVHLRLPLSTVNKQILSFCLKFVVALIGFIVKPFAVYRFHRL